MAIKTVVVTLVHIVRHYGSNMVLCMCYIVEFHCQLANKESEHQGDCARKGSRTQS